MAQPGDYNFRSGEGIDSLRIKNAVIDAQLRNIAENAVQNIARNPSFYESVAAQILSSYLPNVKVALDNKGKESQNNIDNKGFDIAIAYDEIKPGLGQAGISDSFLQGANVIPNIKLVSSYVKRNFFDSSDDVQDTIEIDIPLSSMNISLQKKFVTSTPFGFRGSIKEYAGSSPYQINISGVFVAPQFGDDQDFPEQNRPDVKEFMRLCERPATIDIQSDWVENRTLYDLTQCVVKSYSLPQDLEENNIQRFTMTLESDNLIDID
jgi:hypothetical protein